LDDLRFGVALRAARLRRGWRQRDVAAAARVSDGTVSRIERGHLDAVALGTIRAVARALEIRVEVLPRSRSADVDRLLSARHAGLADAVVRWLGRFDGWVVRPEVSFSRYGERGVIDLLAWHAVAHSVLVIELKTAIVDVGELLGTLDRKARNARPIARDLGWNPASVSCALIVADSSTNRRRIAAHAATFRAAFPTRAIGLRQWLPRPGEPIQAMAFFADRHHGQVVNRFDQRQRVKPRRTSG
jgi:transcriptional regulator with XRE-family HTH domain